MTEHQYNNDGTKNTNTKVPCWFRVQNELIAVKKLTYQRLDSQGFSSFAEIGWLFIRESSRRDFQVNICIYFDDVIVGRRITSYVGASVLSEALYHSSLFKSCALQYVNDHFYTLIKHWFPRSEKQNFQPAIDNSIIITCYNGVEKI